MVRVSRHSLLTRTLHAFKMQMKRRLEGYTVQNQYNKLAKRHSETFKRNSKNI